MNKTADETFDISEIEDVRIIIKAKGKHWSIVPKRDDVDEAKQIRIAMALVLLDSHCVVSTSLEDLQVAIKEKILNNK